MKRNPWISSLAVALAAASCLAAAGAARGSSAQGVPAAALPGPTGIEPVRVVTLDAGPSEQAFLYSIPVPDVEELAPIPHADAPKETYHRLTMGNALLKSEEGKPVIPAVPCRLVLPQGHEIARVVVVPGKKKSLDGAYRVRPGQKAHPLLPGAKPEYTPPDPAIYGSDDPFPAVRYEVGGVHRKRGVSVVVVTLYPLEYRPASGRVDYYGEMLLRVHTRPSVKTPSGGRAVLYRPGAEEALTGMVDNPALLSAYKDERPASLRAAQETRVKGKQGPPWPTLPCDPTNLFDYVVVTRESFRDSSTAPTLTDLIVLKESRGLTATIVTMEDILGVAGYEGRDDAETLRNFIIDAYNTWETEYVLLAGDTEVVPMRGLWCFGGGFVDDIPSDVYFQCLDGDFNSDGDERWGEPTDGPGETDVDLLAEVYIGRASAETEDEIANFVYKILAYENSPDNSSYLTNSLIVGEDLGFGGVARYGKAFMEEIRLGSEAHGYTTAGFAATNLHHVDTLYDADAVWSERDILDLIDSDRYSIINHLGHCLTDYCMKFVISDADDLVNTNFLFTYSQGCYPGAFDDDCIGEHLTTSTRSGMFSAVFNARYGWGAHFTTDASSQRFHRWFWDSFFARREPWLGVMNAYSHEQNIWDIDGMQNRWVFYESNLLGDPATPIYGLLPRPWIRFDRLAYRSDALVGCMVFDMGVEFVAPSVDVGMATTYGEGNVRWTNTVVSPRIPMTFQFTNSVQLTSVVMAVEGDLLTATYVDAGSNLLSTTVPIDDTPPVITNVHVARVTESEGTIRWYTDEPSDSFVMISEYLPLDGVTPQGTTEYTTRTALLDGVPWYVHQVTVGGLAEFTRYNVAVSSADYAGNRTNAPPDLTSTDPADYLTLVTQRRFVSFEDDMESGSEGWTTTNISQTVCWEHGVPTYGPDDAYSGTHCWGTILDGRYPALVNASVVSPVVHLDRLPRLEFRTWHRIQPSSAFADVGYIEVNDGSGWHNVTTNAFPFWYRWVQGVSWGWQQVSVDLSTFSNRNLRARLRLHTDERGTDAGWYVDDLRFT
ncbi:C25 family cysteine peptidase, partial [Verrucomicrobiota bacterium]